MWGELKIYKLAKSKISEKELNIVRKQRNELIASESLSTKIK